MSAPSENDLRVNGQQRKVGLVTRTIIASPVIRWILPARIRHRKLNDVVFVGEDYIEVKQVKSGGHVEPIVTKRDLGSRICSAGVYTIDDPSEPVEDDIFQHHIDYANLEDPVLPAQLLVLILEANVVMFLYLARQSDGTARFKHQIYPLPKWPDALQQIGDHIAIDPTSRAMAVASRGGQIFLYSSKPPQEFKDELASGKEDWCPVTKEQPLDVHGTIQHIAFLFPRSTDTDHVILLVVVTDPSNKHTRLRWFDWRVTTGVRSLQMHDPVPINNGKCVCSLIIPLCNTNFLLVHGKKAHFYRNLLSGTPTDSPTGDIDSSFPPVYPGNSPKSPLWTNWCRPMRSPSAAQGQDSIYLCREDGKVFHLVIYQDGNTLSSCAGDLECHVGPAFASLGDDRNPDLLAVAADNSTGRIVSIGNWPSHRTPDRTRQETMDMKLVELLPNWASVTDMIVTKASSSNSRSSRARDSIFLTSGQQPYGTITEIRSGLEARIVTYIPLSDLSSTLGVWALPDPPTGDVILLLSTPASTVMYRVSGGPEGIEVDSDPGVFTTDERTLMADITRSSQLVQITEKRVFVAGHIGAGFEDKEELILGEGETIVCATTEPELDLVITCRSTSGGHRLAIHTCQTDSHTDDSLLRVGPTSELNSLPLCIASALFDDSALVLIADDTGTVHAYACTGDSIDTLGSFSLDHESPCDQMVLLQAEAKTFLALCSTRDGRLIKVPITASPFSVGKPVDKPFGLSTVKLTRLSRELDRAYATCATDTCYLTLTGSDDINIESIWATDKERPDLLQNQIFGCARLPSSDRLSRDICLNPLGSSLVLLSANELWIADLVANVATIPRQIRVGGTPSRLACAYVLGQRSLICASMRTELTESKDHRRCMPLIEFISLKNNQLLASHTMKPGEDVYSLLDWSPKDKDKSYQFMLVGSKYIRLSNGNIAGGRITFLQPHKDDGIKVRHTVTLDAPVYCMALYDELTFAVCYGQNIALYRFSFEDLRVKAICRPVMMTSPGVAIVCEAPMIYVTTWNDSLAPFCVTSPTADGEPYRIVPSSNPPRAHQGLSHTVVHTGDDLKLAVMSSQHKQIIGFNLPDHVRGSHSRTANILFEAAIPQSITRVRKCDVRPAWQQKPADGVLVDRLVGSCTDGSLVGLAVLEEKLWRRLFWIQRLCERSEVVSPHTYKDAPYTAETDSIGGSVRALPIGLTGSANIMLSAPDKQRNAAMDMHIDGDVLARLLDRGGASALRAMVRDISESQDHIGEWVREHLDAELAAVDECIAGLSSLLKSWL